MKETATHRTHWHRHVCSESGKSYEIDTSGQVDIDQADALIFCVAASRRVMLSTRL